ncbi:MAG: amylo-alpha-1,6-glucosidase [Desulfovibrio sp.]
MNPEAALRREWLDTNGIGGYASSTIINCHTRKYHGLLVAALKEPRGKHVLLSKLETSIVSQKDEIYLSTNKYPNVFHPTGHKFIQEFSLGTYPSITYQFGEHIIRESIHMIHGENTVFIRYELLSTTPQITMRTRPLLAFRGVHKLIRENMHLQPRTYFEKNGFKIAPYDGMPPLYMVTNRMSHFYSAPEWHFNVEYLKEATRGFEYQEDLFSPGTLEFTLRHNFPVIIAASTQPQHPTQLEKKRKCEEERRKRSFQSCVSDSTTRLEHHRNNLQYSGEHFLIRNYDNQASITAGYPWFGEWGRDTMIALPGLTLCEERMSFGFEVLQTYASLEKDGLLPNFLSQKKAECSYNSVDASLWFFWAVQMHLEYGGSRKDVLQKIYPAMRSIIAAHINNAVPHCYLDEYGFIHAGNNETQLTWMDANAYGKPVTPRNGAPVEINALWYNGLMFIQEFFEEANESAEFIKQVQELAKNFAKSFPAVFWNPDQNCLYDVVQQGRKDGSIRPNQIFAVSLPYCALEENQQLDVVETVRSHLVTPYGLRTLSPADPKYRPFYEGNADERDSSYHQGLVWPWLTGHFGDAYLKQAEDKVGAAKFLKDYFKELVVEFPSNYGLNSIAEIYNGNPPYKANGCIAQAWSVAEAIRLSAKIGSFIS